MEKSKLAQYEYKEGITKGEEKSILYKQNPLVYIKRQESHSYDMCNKYNTDSPQFWIPRIYDKVRFRTALPKGWAYMSSLRFGNSCSPVYLNYLQLAFNGQDGFAYSFCFCSTWK